MIPFISQWNHNARVHFSKAIPIIEHQLIIAFSFFSPEE